MAYSDRQVQLLMAATSVVVLLVAVQARAEEAQLLSGRLRRQQISVYFHDLLNVTDVLVAEHKSGVITPKAAPYGALFCVNDRITATSDPKSTTLGAISGLATAASFDGFTNFVTFTVSLDATVAGAPVHLRGLHGTINLFGLVHTVYPKPHGIAGGTGSFDRVQGSSIIVPIDNRTFKQVYRIDLDMYLPA